MRPRTGFSVATLMLVCGLACAGLAGTSDTKEGASPIDVVRGVETTGIDLTLRLGGSISGHVYEADGIIPIDGASVKAYDLDWNWVDTGWPSEQGHYAITGLGRGQYYVVAGEWSRLYECRYYNDSETQEGATAVNLVEGVETTGIHFRLPALSPGPRGSISGRVYEIDGVTPVEGASVVSYSLEGYWMGGEETDQDGDYQIGRLPPGQYRVEAEGGSLEYHGQYYHRADKREDATPVVVLAGTDTPRIHFYLRQWAPAERGSISGHVYESDGVTPVGGVWMEADRLEGWYGLLLLPLTGSDGYYLIPYLLPGQYHVRASGHPDHMPRYYDDSPTPYEATPVTVVGGQDTPGIDFSLPLAGSISGHINEADGQTPATPRTRVFAYDTWWIYVGDTFTDDDGYYKLGGFGTGQYYIVAGEWSEYVPGYYCEGLGVESLRTSPGGLVLRWTSEEGRSYKVLTSTDLSSWGELPQTIPGAPGESFTEWQDPDALSFPRRFYKLKQLE